MSGSWEEYNFFYAISYKINDFMNIQFIIVCLNLVNSIEKLKDLKKICRIRLKTGEESVNIFFLTLVFL